MNEFIKLHEGQVTGVVEGWDRVFQRILLKDFGGWCQRITMAVADRCQAIASAAGRAYLYLPSSQGRKEHLVQKIIARDQLTEGLVCVLACRGAVPEF